MDCWAQTDRMKAQGPSAEAVKASKSDADTIERQRHQISTLDKQITDFKEEHKEARGNWQAKLDEIAEKSKQVRFSIVRSLNVG